MRLLLAASLFVACGLPAEPVTAEDPLDLDAEQQALAVPSEDRPETVDVGSWNVEWYGDPVNGPSPEWRQQTNVERVVKQLDLDLLGLVEVVSPDAFAELLARLPDHAGVLSVDPAFYAAGEQKLALVYRRRFTVEASKLILTQQSWAFAGRPPLEVHLRFTEDGRPRTLVVIVAHFKAMANQDGWSRRRTAATALKTYLDATYPTRWVLVVGDLNDDLDTSTYRGHESPFAELAQSPDYHFTTDALTRAGVATTVEYPNTIDHHLATNELAARYIDGSAHVVKLEPYVRQYGTTTSDHYPVVTRYDLR
ncbi:MAG: endonuclease/exonuclease/phosphatase family protein [Myxococcaceae bacterium]|nr:endonuclease/exonuclease/phosphatase family protein [Myxococcaceae bacterium]